jgi:hypothetical protein
MGSDERRWQIWDLMRGDVKRWEEMGSATMGIAPHVSLF